VAYTVQRATSDGTAQRSHLYVVSMGGRAAPRRLTRAPEGAAQPAWGPDGRWLAFVRPVAGTPQIFLLSLNGGEAYQLTDTPHGATEPTWGPQGKRILFSSTVPSSVVQHRTGRLPPSTRPGRAPNDTVRTVPPDTLLVLRNATTLDPVDTLALGPEGLAAPADTARTLRTPEAPSVPDALRDLRIDSLRTLSPDSVRALFDTLRMRPDTTTVPVKPDTTATPDGDLLQVRRWLDQPRPVRRDVRTGGPTPDHDTYRHYFVVEVPDALERRTPPPTKGRLVTRGYRSYGDVDWLPGGRQLVVSAPPLPSRSTTSPPEKALYVVDLQDGRASRLLHVDGHTLLSPRVTTDGTTIAFQVRSVESPSYAQTNVGLFSLDGRADPEFISGDFDYDVSSLRWSPDGWFLYVAAQTGTGHPVYRFAPFAQSDTTNERGSASLDADRTASRDSFALDSSMVRTALYDRMTSKTRRIRSLDVTDATAVYAAADRDSPSELFANTVSFGNERLLSSHNDWLANRRLADTRFLTARPDSLPVQARLTRPVLPTDTVRPPLVVLPRGGPPALDRPSPTHAWFERQYLAGRGYAVVEAWPRGSSGYGAAFRRRNHQDWGPGPMADVQAVVDSVAAQSWVDADRRGLAGHGYGATLASWMIAHTDQFQAAVAHDGIYDLSSLLERPDGPALLRDQFGPLPWTDTTAASRAPLLTLAADSLSALRTAAQPDTTLPASLVLRYNSPLTHAPRIETPLLLTQGPGAPTDGASADALYRRLQTLGRPVEYVRYAASSPSQRRERIVRLYEFLARFLPPEPPSASE